MDQDFFEKEIATVALVDAETEGVVQVTEVLFITFAFIVLICPLSTATHSASPARYNF